MGSRQLILYKGYHIYIRCPDGEPPFCKAAFAIAKDHGDGTIGRIYHAECLGVYRNPKSLYAAASAAACNYIDALTVQAKGDRERAKDAGPMLLAGCR